ncbi:MAG: transketolase [Faecalimonas umbilicata]|uniref:transketolase n=1 Tax=Faecalimonas umbilicata TaxID=1912855 RepID=UPI00242C8014|nr:transketolase [Faecalimonas umbilicata]MCI5986304.1 transketolase [Faecalimonas umbilicata]MDY5091987.1 transketolase [Faecalimonas umbilicata]
MNSEELAWKIRRHGIEMTHLSGGSHIGAILSVADIIAVLYSGVMNIDPKNPKKMDRDRFILSKGHAGASIYAALAENGFFEVEELKTHYQNGSRLSGHVSHHLLGVDFSTGSLGHGLSAGVGMAYAAKKDGKSHKVYVVLGDGECDEGSVWEAALFANHFRLNNLVAIVDHNHMQSMDFQENTLEIEDFGEKWKAFGWNVIEMDGNSHEELNIAFEQAEKLSKEEAHKPTVIIANTIKGFGVSFMQNDILWHYRFPHEGWEYDCAVAELHKCKPEGVEDPYTPDGIENPAQPTERDDIGNDHTFSYTWDTSYPEKMRRVEAKSGSDEREHRV